MPPRRNVPHLANVLEDIEKVLVGIEQRLADTKTAVQAHLDSQEPESPAGSDGGTAT